MAPGLPDTSRRLLLVRVAAAVAGGLLLYCAFPPVSWGWLALPAVFLVTWAAWSASWWQGAVSGLAAGLAFFVPLLQWMTVIGSDAWLALSVFCAGWMALLGIAIALVSRLPGSAVWVACAWGLEEALRGRIPWGGFPWGSLGFSAPDQPWAPALSVVGVSGSGVVLALVGASAVAAVDGRRVNGEQGNGERGTGEQGTGPDGRRPFDTRWAVVAAIALAALVALPRMIGLPPSSGTLFVAVVQGGTPQLGMGAMDVRRAVLDNHVRQTLGLARDIAAGTAAQPDLVIWPENASDIDPLADASAASAITAAARAVDAPILVGAVLAARTPDGTVVADGVWNAGMLWLPSGKPTQVYVKNHPVPFGEYIPFRQQLAGLIGRFDRVPHDFLAGDKPGIMQVGSATIGDVICFEIAYPDVVDAVAGGGAQLIAVQTNNATYGGTAQPDQQLEISRARAIEQGRVVAIAATTGVSAFIGPTGEVLASMPQGRTGYLVEQATLADQRTLASTWGSLLEALTCAVAAGALVAALLRSARQRRRARHPSASLSLGP